jgi:hypothetical protein
MWGCREEADVGGMAAVDIGVRDAGDYREIVTVTLKDLEVGRRRVLATSFGGKELNRQQTKVVANPEHAASVIKV